MPTITSCPVFAADVFVRVLQLQPWLFACAPQAESFRLVLGRQ
jgi:hypothetical protein